MDATIEQHRSWLHFDRLMNQTDEEDEWAAYQLDQYLFRPERSDLYGDYHAMTKKPSGWYYATPAATDQDFYGAFLKGDEERFFTWLIEQNGFDAVLHQAAYSRSDEESLRQEWIDCILDRADVYLDCQDILISMGYAWHEEA